MRWFWKQYLRDPRDGGDPMACPSRAEKLTGLPPATVITRHLQAAGAYWVVGDDHLRFGQISAMPGTLMAIPIW